MIKHHCDCTNLRYMMFRPAGFLSLPPANSASPSDQEEYQQGQRRVPPATGEEQHRGEKEPG